MKILLLHSQWSHAYGNYSAAAKASILYPPLGLCYLASSIKNEGHEVKIIDAEIEGMSIKEVVEEAKKYSPDLIGITSTTPIFPKVRQLAETLKKALDTPIVLGGPHITVMPGQTMEENECFDFGVYGEGEKTICALIRELQGKKKFENIRGLMYRKDGNVVKNKPRQLEQNLDSIAFPDRASLKLNEYLWSVPGKGIVKFASIITARGCPFNCIFCSQRAILGSKVRFRSPENIIKEIEEIVKKYKIKHFVFLDDTLTLDRNRIMELSKLLIEKSLDISWEGWTRANTIDKEMLTLMKKSGFVRISFGIESGNEEILKIIKKGITLKQLRDAYKLTKEIGIEARGTAMIGHPFETKSTVNDTIKFIRSLDGCDQIYLGISTPYPGTELYKMAINGDGGLKLLTKDFSSFRRWGDSAVEVNDLSKEDLVRLQRWGIFYFYSTPRRIIYNLRRAGIKSGLKNLSVFLRGMIG